MFKKLYSNTGTQAKDPGLIKNMLTFAKTYDISADELEQLMIANKYHPEDVAKLVGIYSKADLGYPEDLPPWSGAGGGAAVD